MFRLIIRDTYEKEHLIMALGEEWNDEFLVNYDDIIILGDCDEIPRASIIQRIKNNFQPDQIYHLGHDFYWYYMNVLKTNEKWFGNIVCSFNTFKNRSFCEMRQKKTGIFIENSGWHFTYMPISRIKTKIESWGEQSLNTHWVKDNIEQNVENCLLSDKDLFFRPAKFRKVPITYETHPSYLVEHTNEFKEFIL